MQGDRRADGLDEQRIHGWCIPL